MKLRYSLFLWITFFTLQLAVKAQIVNNLVVFSNEGERFTLILDGLKENQTPATNVRVVGLDLKVYQVKVIFENKRLKDVNTTLTFFRTGKECVFGLNKHGKKHTMDYVSEKEIDGFIDPATQQNLNTNTSTNTQTQITGTTPTPTVSTFQTVLSNIAAQPTDEGKLNATLTMLQNGTLNIGQIKQVFALFATDQSRLAFAKQACKELKDPNLYIEIINLFTNGPIRQELQLFLQSKK
jgi:hypothetical protein